VPFLALKWSALDLHERANPEENEIGAAEIAARLLKAETCAMIPAVGRREATIIDTHTLKELYRFISCYRPRTIRFQHEL